MKNEIISSMAGLALICAAGCTTPKNIETVTLTTEELAEVRTDAVSEFKQEYDSKILRKLEGYGDITRYHHLLDQGKEAARYLLDDGNNPGLMQDYLKIEEMLDKQREVPIVNFYEDFLDGRER